MPLPCLRSIKSKTASVVVFILAVLGAVVLLISIGFYRNYRALLVAEARSLLVSEKERTDKDIRRLEGNVRELALIGKLLHLAGRDKDFDTIGRQAVIRNFEINTLAVGGGIWFEPYGVYPDRELASFYAHNEDGRSRHDPRLATPEYHYPTQPWYTSIKRQVADGGRKVAWTPPYFDDTGTMSVMTTAGSGIYDETGALVGMATVDWRLETIADSIAAIRPTPGSFVLFADPANDFVLANSDPNDEASDLGKPLSAVPWYRDGGSNPELLEYRGITFYSFRTSFDNGMILVVNIPVDELEKDISRGLARLCLVLAGAGLLMAGVIHIMLDRFINRPVAYLSEKAGEIGGGNLDADICLASGDELAALGDTLRDMAANLKTRIRELRAVTAEKERIGAELDIAREIQASMLPSIFPPYPDREEFDIYASMIPAKEVGGDFYDFFMVDDDRVAVVIADVSGKGVPAALFMVVAKTLVRNHAQMGLPPAEVFGRVNEQLCDNNQVGMFVTAFMGVLDVTSGSFDYVNAGHNPPILFSGGAADFLPVRPGFILGGMPEIRYRQGNVSIRPGDCLFLYTDGVTEAENGEGGLFGNARLMANANKWFADRRDGMIGLLTGIKTDVDAFAAGTPQSDDLTMLGLAYYGSGGAPCGK